MSEALWNIVICCWNHSPPNRPSAEQVAQTLHKISLTPSEIPYGRYRPPATYFLLDMQDIVASYFTSTSGRRSPEPVYMISDHHVVRSLVIKFASKHDLRLPGSGSANDWFGGFKSIEATHDSLLLDLTTLPGLASAPYQSVSGLVDHTASLGILARSRAQAELLNRAGLTTAARVAGTSIAGPDIVARYRAQADLLNQKGLANVNIPVSSGMNLQNIGMTQQTIYDQQHHGATTAGGSQREAWGGSVYDTSAKDYSTTGAGTTDAGGRDIPFSSVPTRPTLHRAGRYGEPKAGVRPSLAARDRGEGVYSSAFGLMSLDDPAVLAGLANDGEPFFTSVQHQGHSEESSEGRINDHMHHSDAGLNASDIEPSATSGSHASSGTSLSSFGAPNFGGSSTIPLATLEELKEFWKQYMRTPLNGPGSSDIFANPPASAQSGHGHEGELVTPYQIPGFGTPRFNPNPQPPPFHLTLNPLRWNQEISLSSTTNPSNPSSNSSAYAPGSTAGTNHGDDNLKRYKQAVLARKTPTLLNLAPRRRGAAHLGAISGSSQNHSYSQTQQDLARQQEKQAQTAQQEERPSNSLPKAFDTAEDQQHKEPDSRDAHSPTPSVSSEKTILGYASPSATADATMSPPSVRAPAPSRHSTSSASASPVVGGASSRPSFKRLASPTLAPENSKRVRLGARDGLQPEEEDGEGGDRGK